MNFSIPMKDSGTKYARLNQVFKMHICQNTNLNHTRIYLLTTYNLQGTNGLLKKGFNPIKLKLL